MKKSFLLIGSLCIVALGVLGYTLLYAGSANSTAKNEKECAAACEKAHGGAYHDAASSGECPHAAKAAAHKDAEGCCAAKGTAEAGAAHDKSTCPSYATMGNMSKEECAKFHETARAKAESEEKIEIK